MNHSAYTGIANDDRRITAELHAMGAFDGSEYEQYSQFQQLLKAVSGFITWMRWKGEVSAYGCRIGASYARALEASAQR
ncbi:MAG TPA: hypothetical protein VIS52_05990 [Motiliproteus sp.]